MVLAAASSSCLQAAAQRASHSLRDPAARTRVPQGQAPGRCSACDWETLGPAAAQHGVAWCLGTVLCAGSSNSR